MSFASSGRAGFKPAGRPLRVLIVDDEPDTVMTLTAILRDEGYGVLGCMNPQRALDAIEGFDPDVAIVDIAMPGLSGWELAREIRNTTGKRPLLIAITGAYTKPPDEILSRVAGFNHFLKKPADPVFLLNILAAVTPN